ncbi:MAG: aspartate-semialdehyde dehydrogenase [Bacteroidetes bacterium]|nr:MAG: aspartate-semialdehyde dehydrogenase [Bacteroidota bacterium]
MKVALVGATGLVGGIMLKVLEEENFPVSELYPVASEKSVGKTVEFKGKQITIISADEAISKRPDIALFSAGGSTSLELAPKFAEVGTVVIDNSSAWRMDPTKKLIVPEINGSTITPEDKIIANPNCSTIQMVMALAPLHKKYTIKRLVVSTYQSVTGTGQKAVAQLTNERKGVEGEMAYKYPIDMNCIPHCDVFLDNGYTKEEMKMVHETRKILGDNNIKVTATAVRVPVVGGHSEAINIEFEKPYEIGDVFSILKNTEGVEVVDDVENFKYPMPMLAANRNEVLVGRIRRDDSVENGLNMWVVADNLRKGAATNALQIAQLVAQMKSAVN